LGPLYAVKFLLFFLAVFPRCCYEPPSGDEDIPAESPAPRKGYEKKRRRAPSFSSSKKKRTKRSLLRKSKGSTGARAPSSDSLLSLRDESEEE